ncbi:MAG: prepilin-type N-terminal cleavage/methylation domain-containing protein [Rickettsiales bacterium]|nr:prepilin-type N-terminal cleavage/methylation domain-containing protein [Rickettsiales bacterium]
MKKTFSSKKSAFSLIELSIVLIVIGLLIAGVTGGASLIKSSELRSIMGEARAYSVAVSGFYSQYSYLPGDYATSIGGAAAPSTTTAAYAGSSSSAQNARIEYNTASVATYLSESVAAWDQMVKSGTVDIPSLTLAATTTAQVAGTNMPASKIKSAGWHFDYRTSVGTTGTDYGSTVNEGAAAAPAYQNVVVLTGTTTAASTTDTTSIALTLVNGATNLASASVTGPDAMSIDTKIDDSFANAGRVRGLNPGNTTGCYTLSTTANQNYIVTSTTNKTCALTFQVDVNS